MAAYYREELTMLMQSLLSYSTDLLKCKSKRQRRLIESDIAVVISEIEDAYRDLATELLTENL